MTPPGYITDPTPSEFPGCVSCGHRAWTHGDQSGFPPDGAPCHADRVGEECRDCPDGYRRPGRGTVAVNNAITQLASRGDADAIAAELERLGITGQLAAPTLCPVALYVLVATSARVFIGETFWTFKDQVTEHPLPKNVAGFVEAYDGGCFPNLIEGGSEPA